MSWADSVFSPYLMQYMRGQPLTPAPGDSNLTSGVAMLPFQALAGLDKMTAQGPGGFGSYLSGEAGKSWHYAFAPATGPAAPETPPGQKPFARASANPASAVPSDTASLPANARGVRNNNYLNLTLSPFTQKQPGFVGTDQGGRYAVFASPEQGKSAAEKLLGSYVSRGYDTPAEIIGRWAPAAENGGASTSNYVRYVASGLGIGPNDKISKQQIPFLADRMAEFENGAGKTGPALGAFNSAADAVGLNQPMPQFDSSGYQAANSLLGKAQTNVMQPFSATYPDVPMPELPKPQDLQTPDYTAGDQAMQAAQPKNPFGGTPEEVSNNQLKMRRMDYFSGMAQALGSIDWSRGVGLGELFAKLGAGALMGAKSGDREVQDKMESFDKSMQQYQLAVAGRDDNKARESINIANQNISQLNDYKRAQWQTQFQEWQKDQPQIVDGVLVTKTKKDGQVVETHTPLDPARQSAALMARANNAIAASNAKNEYDWQTYRANRELAGAALPYAMSDAANQGNLQGRDGIAAVGLSEASIAATETGQWEQLYSRYLPGGDARAAAVKQQALASAGVQQGTNPTQEQSQAINSYISSQLMQDFVNSGRSWVLVGGPASNPKLGKLNMNPAPETASAIATRREQDKKTRQTVNPKGQVSTTTSY